MENQTQKKLVWYLFKLYKLINNQAMKLRVDELLRSMGNIFLRTASGFQMPKPHTSPRDGFSDTISYTQTMVPARGLQKLPLLSSVIVWFLSSQPLLAPPPPQLLPVQDIFLTTKVVKKYTFVVVS